MPTSNKLTDERLKEIAALPVTYDDDIPEFSDSDLKGFAPAHPEYFKVTPIKKAISIKIDLDVLEALKAQGYNDPQFLEGRQPVKRLILIKIKGLIVFGSTEMQVAAKIMNMMKQKISLKII